MNIDQLIADLLSINAECANDETITEECRQFALASALLQYIGSDSVTAAYDGITE